MAVLAAPLIEPTDLPHPLVIFRIGQHAIQSGLAMHAFHLQCLLFGDRQVNLWPMRHVKG